jgi:YebC/PmpR family DNA-binding regulatory protein
MSGHSKWSQIKRQKAVTDGARSRVFSRLARHITLESKKAGGVLTAPALSAIIARAKVANMPKENIERAIAKGASKDAGSLEQVTYEAYGPSGVAIIVEALTDNKNRTTQEIRHVFTKQGLELSPQGSTVWAFTKKNGSYIPNPPLVVVSEADEEKLNALLDELDGHEDTQDMYTNADGYENIGN